MYKNIAIVLLACCCIYLVVSQRMERNAWEERPLGAAAYGGLIALRDVLPPAEYQKEVVPFLERAAAEGHASYRQLQDLDDKLRDLGNQALEAARKARCYDFVMALPDGFDTVIGEGGESLSGGERQKVLLGRALVQQPKLLLLDEPTSALDLRNQYEMLSLVRCMCAQTGITAVLVLHDLNLALRFCDRLLLLSDGTVHACGGAEIMTSEHIRAVYGMDASVRTVDGVPVVIPHMAEQ